MPPSKRDLQEQRDQDAIRGEHLVAAAESSAVTSVAAVPAMLLMIAVESILPNPDNPRKSFPDAELDELGQSLLAVGQMTPCLVRPHPTRPAKYDLAAGESRWRAAKRVGILTLECHVRNMTDPQFYTVLAWENLKRRNLKPLEEARSYELLLKKSEGWQGDKWTVARIAKEGGCSVDYVRDRLRLLRLTLGVQRFLDEGSLPLTHALEIAKLTAEQQARIVDPKEWDGAWRDDDVARASSQDRTTDPLSGKAAVSLNELKFAIAETFPLDVQHESTPDLFPDLTEAVAAAAAAAMPVVYITDNYQPPTVAKGAPELLGKRAWRRADGTKGAKACKLATQLGVGVHGSDAVRGQAFTVCTATTECRTHFGEEIAEAALRAKRAAAHPERKGQRVEQPWEVKDRKAREEKARLQPVLPHLRTAIAAAIAKASTKVGGPLDKLIRHREREDKAKGEPARGQTPEDLMRLLAYRSAVSRNEYHAHEELPKAAKLLGVDVAALIKQHAPAPTKAAKQKVAPKQKAAKKAKAKKGGAK